MYQSSRRCNTKGDIPDYERVAREVDEAVGQFIDECFPQAQPPSGECVSGTTRFSISLSQPPSRWEELPLTSYSEIGRNPSSLHTWTEW